MDLIAFDDLPLSRGRLVRANGLELALFRVGEEVYAIADSCPHAGASLSGGMVNGCQVACRAHGLRFDLRTGCVPGVKGLAVKTYPLRVVDGRVVLDEPSGAGSETTD